MEISFWDIYWPMLAASISAAIIFEATFFAFRWIAHRLTKDAQQKMLREMFSEAGIQMGPDGQPLVFMDDLGGMRGVPYPTVSGGNNPNVSHGQYL